MSMRHMIDRLRYSMSYSTETACTLSLRMVYNNYIELDFKHLKIEMSHKDMSLFYICLWKW